MSYTGSELARLNSAVDEYIRTASKEEHGQLTALSRDLAAAQYTEASSHMSRDVIRVGLGATVFLVGVFAAVDLGMSLGTIEMRMYEAAAGTLFVAMVCLEVVWIVATALQRRRVRRLNNQMLDRLRMPPDFPRL